MLTILSNVLFCGMIYFFGWGMGYEHGMKKGEKQNYDYTGTDD